MIAMDVAESYVMLCGEVSKFTMEKTGVGLVDAYFGPEYLKPELQAANRSPVELIHEVRALMDRIHDDVDSGLRADYLAGECESMAVVVEWLDREDTGYSDLIRGIFHIPMKEFPQSDIDDEIDFLSDALRGHPGTDLYDRVTRFNKQGEITGTALQTLIETDLQGKSIEVGREFHERIYSLLGTSVTDNGVEYQVVREAPWSGYNWYQPGYKSINQFNLDVTFNKYSLLSVIYHEYEHHVSNLWREKYYRENNHLELAVVPLHTGRCVISEGSADTAKEFLHIIDEEPHLEIIDSLNSLRRMTSINAAIMLNDKKKSVEEVMTYMIDSGFRTPKSAKSSLGFISPRQPDGRLNFWAPYVFTYFFGRNDFVLPTFNKAADENQLGRFYQTLYLNPYSGSSVTWKHAFDWLN